MNKITYFLPGNFDLINNLYGNIEKTTEKVKQSLTDWLNSHNVSCTHQSESRSNIHFNADVTKANYTRLFLMLGLTCFAKGQILDPNPPQFFLSGLNGVNGFPISGANSGDQSGYSVASLGDINGDGIHDILMGARYAATSSGQKVGKVFALFGKPMLGYEGSIDLSSLNGTNGFMIAGEAAGDQFGWSVSCDGDYNDDGIDDILVGAPYADAAIGLEDAGKAYIIFGSPNIGESHPYSLSMLTPSKGVVFFGESNGDKLGFSVSSAGDFNHDGNDDVIVGAPNSNGGDGTTYILYGRADLNSTFLVQPTRLTSSTGLIIKGGFIDDLSGYSVSSCGDVNDDNITDIIIGARSGQVPGRLYAGRAFILFGGQKDWEVVNFQLPNLNGTNGFIVYGFNGGDYTGSAVSGGGDINRDGYADVVIGATNAHATTGIIQSGKAYVIFGKPNLGINGLIDLANVTDADVLTINGAARSESTGGTVYLNSDINNDGFDDVLISSKNSQAGYVVFGSANIQSKKVVNLSTLNGIDGLKLRTSVNRGNGFSSLSSGDINQDGIPEVILGLPESGLNSGTTYIVSYNKLTQKPPTTSTSTIITTIPTTTIPVTASSQVLTTTTLPQEVVPPNPQDAEFRLNTVMTGYQNYPKVAALADGNFLVTWEGRVDKNLTTLGRIFSPLGIPSQLPELRIDPKPRNSLGAFASNYQTGFIAAWSSRDSRGLQLFARQYHVLDTPIGDEVHINQDPNTIHSNPHFESTKDQVIFAWRQLVGGGRTSGSRIKKRIYYPFNQTFGLEELVSPTSQGLYNFPTVVLENEKDHTIFWSKLTTLTSETHIQMRRYSTDPQGASQNLTLARTSHLDTSYAIYQAAKTSSDRFALTWLHSESRMDIPYLVCQLFFFDGKNSSNDFNVTAFSYQGIAMASLFAIENGDFLVSWIGTREGEQTSGLYARIFNARGEPQNNDIQINQNAGVMREASGTQLKGGQLAFAWTHRITDMDGDIHGRILEFNQLTSGLILTNFETTKKSISTSISFSTNLTVMTSTTQLISSSLEPQALSTPTTTQFVSSSQEPQSLSMPTTTPLVVGLSAAVGALFCSMMAGVGIYFYNRKKGKDIGSITALEEVPKKSRDDMGYQSISYIQNEMHSARIDQEYAVISGNPTGSHYAAFPAEQADPSLDLYDQVDLPILNQQMQEYQDVKLNEIANDPSGKYEQLELTKNQDESYSILPAPNTEEIHTPD